MAEWSQAPHSRRMWAEFSSSAPHLLHKRILVSPIRWMCLLRVLCPVNRPITTLHFILSKDKSLVFAAGLGPEINSLACLWVLPRHRHLARCLLSIQNFIFLLIFCLETPKDGSGPTNVWTEPSLASLSAISFPRIPARPGTQNSPIVCRVEISFNYFWHCRTNGDVVLVTWRAFRAAWVSEQILTYFSGPPCNWIS